MPAPMLSSRPAPVTSAAGRGAERRSACSHATARRPATERGGRRCCPGRCYPPGGATPALARHPGDRPGAAGPRLPVALQREHRRQLRRRRRARRRAAPRRLADPGPVPRVSLAVTSGYLPMLLFGIPGGAVADRVDRKRMVVWANLARAAVLARPRRDDRQRQRQHRDRPRRAVRARHGGDVRRQRQQHARARPRREGRPGHRERPDAGRLRPDEPARRAADRRVPVRGRRRAAVRDERDLLRARRGADLAGRGQHAGPDRRADEPSGGPRRGRPLAAPPPADADARGDDLPVQRHVRRRVGRARPLRRRAPRPGPRRVRVADDGRRGRRDHRDRVVRGARAAVRARGHHAGRAC